MAVMTVDGERYSKQDAAGTFAALGPWWEQLCAGRDAGAALAVATRNATALGGLLQAPAGGEPLAALDRLGRKAQAELLAAPWNDATRARTEGLLAMVLTGVYEAGAALRAAGALPATATGRVTQVSASPGGVPKRPVAALTINVTGAVGDRQATRRHHGRPWQAVCVWSSDVIDALAAEGHPVFPGATGENITITGIEWADVRAGVHLQLGEVRVEVTVFALPCRQNARWFAGGEYRRMHHDRGPVSRVYARVLAGGCVAGGDAVVLEP